MATEIYYFSGTGNSLVVARDIAGRLEGRLIPVASVLAEVRIRPGVDVMGIVFPVHNVVNGGVPSIIMRFLSRLEGIASTYIFAVCTCGAGAGEALSNIEKQIKAKGGKLAAGFTVKMPFNCPPFTKEDEQLQRFRDWDRQLAEVVEIVAARKESKIKKLNPVVNIALYPLGVIMHSLILNNYRKLAGASGLAFYDTVSLIDRSFTVDDNCNGCGICAEVCPVNNIEIVDRRPVWQHHCESCLSCFAWCPQQAINGGILSGKTERYHHPGVTLPDMLKHKGRPLASPIITYVKM
jgi:ferredoxin